MVRPDVDLCLPCQASRLPSSYRLDECVHTRVDSYSVTLYGLGRWELDIPHSLTPTMVLSYVDILSRCIWFGRPRTGSVLPPPPSFTGKEGRIGKRLEDDGRGSQIWVSLQPYTLHN